MITSPFLISLYRFIETQMGNAITPMTKDTASLMTMKISIVRHPPMQIILFMKPDSTDKPQNKADCVIRPIPVHFPGAIQSPGEA